MVPQPPQFALNCLNCTKFVKLILSKIIETVATRCYISKLKCTKFDFGCGSAPDPAVGGRRQSGKIGGKRYSDVKPR